MDSRTPEPKRSSKGKILKHAAAAYDDDDDELTVDAVTGSVEEDEKRKRPYNCSSSSSSSVSTAVGGGGIRKGPGGGGGSGGGGGGVAQPSCQAEKCEADLNTAKRYHRRHKVCEAHSKAPVVIVAGLRQRFCQQCSRFHELSEFDDAKRSCRRRLAGHNERRRKVSSESQGEGSNRCMQSSPSASAPISLPGNPSYKHFQIR